MKYGASDLELVIWKNVVTPEIIYMHLFEALLNSNFLSRAFFKSGLQWNFNNHASQTKWHDSIKLNLFDKADLPTNHRINKPIGSHLMTSVCKQ